MQSDTRVCVGINNSASHLSHQWGAESPPRILSSLYRGMEGAETVVSGVVTGVETPVSRVESVTLKLRLYFHL